MCFKQQGRSEGQKHVGLILNFLWRWVTCKKNASKNIIPSKRYEFLKIWVAIKLLHLDTMHVGNLEFGMYRCGDF